MNKQFVLTNLAAAIASVSIMHGVGYANTTPLSVQNPSANHFFFGIEGLYQQVVNSNQSFADVYGLNQYTSTGISGFVDTTTLWSLLNHSTLKPGYDGAFRLEAGVLMHGTPNDLSVNWEHYRASANGVASVGQNSTLWLNPSLIDFSALVNNNIIASISTNTIGITPTAVTAKQTNQLDAVNLVFGHRFSSTLVDGRVFGGVGFASIKQKLAESAILGSTSTVTTSIINPAVQVPVLITGTIAPYYISAVDNYQFNGVGPEMGVDLYRPLGVSDISLAGHGTAALLVGTGKTQFNVFGTNPLQVSSSTINVVPNFNLKLGVNYSHSFVASTLMNAEGGAEVGSTDGGILSIEAGWEVNDYINAIRSSGDNSTEAALYDCPAGGCVSSVGEGGANVFSGASYRTVNALNTKNTSNYRNFALQGPYLKVSYTY